jgi:hypothetical protein
MTARFAPKARASSHVGPTDVLLSVDFHAGLRVSSAWKSKAVAKDSAFAALVHREYYHLFKSPLLEGVALRVSVIQSFPGIVDGQLQFPHASPVAGGEAHVASGGAEVFTGTRL